MLPTNETRPSTEDDIKIKIKTLYEQKNVWPTVPTVERLTIIDRLIRDFLKISRPLVAESIKAKGIDGSYSLDGEEWTLGPYSVLRYLHLLKKAYSDINKYGRPRVPGPIRLREGNQLAVGVFPPTIYDRVFFRGVSAEVWLDPGLTLTEFRTGRLPGEVNHQQGMLTVILSAGNATSMPPGDALYKLFVENHVALIKTHPIQMFLRPFLEEGLRALIDTGVLAIVDGGTEEGVYLCQQPEVDEIHIVGSRKTFEAVVSNLKPTNAKQDTSPMKRITAELECVSPFIIIPGDWSDNDIDYQAEQIVSSLVINAGFDCTTPRVVIQHTGWSQRNKLLERIRHLLGQIPSRVAYYPNAINRHAAFLKEHPEAEHFGAASAGQLPWTFIPNLDWRNAREICFTNESFCSLYAETGIQADTVPEYIERAVEFANQTLTGDLSATVLIHPSSHKHPEVAASFDKAIKNLKYGTVAINYWAGVGYPASSNPWGSFAGGDATDVQSGIGFVNNAFMLPRPQKTVLRGPFRSWPKPIWFISQSRKAQRVFPMLAELEASPSLSKVPRILWNALRG